MATRQPEAESCRSSPQSPIYFLYREKTYFVSPDDQSSFALHGINVCFHVGIKATSTHLGFGYEVSERKEEH